MGEYDLFLPSSLKFKSRDLPKKLKYTCLMPITVLLKGKCQKKFLQRSVNGFHLQNIFWLLLTLTQNLRLASFSSAKFLLFLKGKSSKKFSFETLSLDYVFCRKVTKPNFEFGTSFILWLFSKYVLKMPKNESQKSEKFNYEPSRDIFWKSCRE